MFRASKVVGALPGTLTPDTLYCVRVGEGFDLYVSDSTGTVAHPLNASGGGGGPAPLGLHDWWDEIRFATTNVSQPPFLGAAVSGGTTNATVIGSLNGLAPYGVRLRSHATNTNSGYRYITSSQVADVFGVTSRKFRAQFRPLATTDVIFLAGFHDITSLTAGFVDGAWFELSSTSSVGYMPVQNLTSGGGVVSASWASGDILTLEIDVSADASSARFRVWKNATTTPIVDQTVTTQIPTGSNAFGAGFMAAQPSAGGARDLCVLHSMGIGTIAGFERARG